MSFPEETAKYICVKDYLCYIILNVNKYKQKRASQ